MQMSLHSLPREIQNAYRAKQEAGEYRDLTKQTNMDFAEGIAMLQACKEGKTINQTRLKEMKNTVLGDSDFAETMDLTLDQPGGFWDKITADTQSLANVRAEPTSAHVIYDNELTLGANGEDVFRPGVEGTDPGDTGTVDTAQRSFTPEEVIGVWGMTDTVLEDNIERGTLQSHLERMIVDAASREWAKAIWNGTMVGTTNSSRGSITGCFNGFIQQINDGGNIVYSTAYEDRYVSSIEENDKFLGAAKLLPEKYGTDGMTWMTTKGIMLDWKAHTGQRATNLGDAAIGIGSASRPALYASFMPMYNVPCLRTNYLVKGTGTVGATTPVDTTLSAIHKARVTTLNLTAVDNTGTGLVYAIGCDAAGTSFDLNAEKVTQTGAATALTVGLTAALARDHASLEKVTEYSDAPTVTGVPAVLTSWDNLLIKYQRVAKIEPYRTPRTRQTYWIMTARFVPIVMNPDAAVLIRDLAVRA